MKSNRHPSVEYGMTKHHSALRIPHYQLDELLLHHNILMSVYVLSVQRIAESGIVYLTEFSERTGWP